LPAGLAPAAVGPVLVVFGVAIPILGDSRILLALALFALLFVSSGCGLVSRLGRMLLRVAGLGLLDWLFCSALLRWRGLTLPTL
jgi:hypothetical protein